MTLISTNTSHKFGPDKTHFKSFIQYPPLRKVTEHSKKLFCRCCKKGLWLCCNRNNYQNTWQTSRAYFLLLELLFLFCEFLTQLIKYLEEKPYVGKTSSGIQSSFSGDVSRTFCYYVKIEATNKILGKKVLYKENIKWPLQ